MPFSILVGVSLGCLRIDQPHFYYKLDEGGMPIAMQCREHWASCQLIEELALLTNMVTAQMIYAVSLTFDTVPLD